VTLASLDIPAPPGVVERFLEANREFQIPPALLTRFALYSSDIRADVPRYQEVGGFPLVEAPPVC
jgi:hypothetical protein